MQPSFQTYLGRLSIDLSFYVIVSVIGMGVISAILIVRFNQLRTEIVRLHSTIALKCVQCYCRIKLKRTRKISVLFVVLKVIALNEEAR